MWQHLKDFVPLAQTVLWVGLIAWLVKRYSETIDRLLDLLKNRIETGSSLKAGPFEIGETIKPSPIANQRLETELEIDDFLVNNGKSTTLGKSRSSIRSEYYQAEDLAIRALQEEYNTTIQRNVRIDSNFEVDGIFVKYGIVYFVEVKIATKTNFLRIARKALQRLDKDVLQQNLPNANIILVIVHLDDNPVTHVSRQELIDTSAVKTKINIVTFELRKLKETFDLS